MAHDIKRAARTPVDFELLTRCMAGVLVCRGFPESEALSYAETVASPKPDKPIVDLSREVGSVLLTLQAHGKLATALDH